MCLEALEPLRGRLQLRQRRSPVAGVQERGAVIDELVDVAAAQLFSGSGSGFSFFFGAMVLSARQLYPLLGSRGLQRCPLCWLSRDEGRCQPVLARTAVVDLSTASD